MLFQNSPTLRDPVIARYRKFWMGRLMSGCRRLFQREPSVSRLPVISWIANLVMSRFVSVCLVYCVLWHDRIASYAIFCDKVANLIPRSRKASGMLRSTSSGCVLWAPLFASRSACLFPRLFVYPLTHLKLVGAALRRNW